MGMNVLSIDSTKKEQPVVGVDTSAITGDKSKNNPPPKTVGAPEDGLQSKDKKPQYDKEVITYTVQEGDYSLREIALKFGTTVAELKANNDIPGKNHDYIIAGKTKLQINALTEKGKKQKAAHEAVVARQEQLEEQKYAQEDAAKAKQIQTNIKVANKKIENAQGLEHLKDTYNFSVDKEGNIVLTLKKELQVKEMKEDFDLKEGVLKNNNDLAGKTKRGFFDFKNNNKLDFYYAKEGTTFVIPVNAFNPVPHENSIAGMKK